MELISYIVVPSESACVWTWLCHSMQ